MKYCGKYLTGQRTNGQMNKQLPEQTGQKHNATADTVG